MSEAHFDMGRRSHRRFDPDTGELGLKATQTLFIEWLCGDRAPGDTQKAFAERHGMAASTLSEWKKDRDFRTRWEERMRDTHAAPDRQHKLLEKLYEEALQSGNEKKIETYFKLINKMTPDRIEIDDRRELAEMSDDELADLADNVSFLRRNG